MLCLDSQKAIRSRGCKCLSHRRRRHRVEISLHLLHLHIRILSYLNFPVLLNQRLLSVHTNQKGDTQQSQHQWTIQSEHPFPSMSYFLRISFRFIHPKINWRPGQSVARAAYPIQSPLQHEICSFRKCGFNSRARVLPKRIQGHQQPRQHVEQSLQQPQRPCWKLSLNWGRLTG